MPRINHGGFVGGFRATNRSTGVTENLFLSYSSLDYSNRNLDSLRHLSLGESLFDWQEKTLSEQKVLYEYLLEESTRLLSEKRCPGTSRRDVEILVGHLALQISRRLARSAMQMEGVASSHILEKNPVDGGSRLSLELPVRTQDSYRSLASTAVSRLIDQMAIARAFGVEYEMELTAAVVTESRTSLNTSALERFLRHPYLLLQRMFTKATSRSRVSLSSTYLGRFSEFMLHLLLGQIPSLLELTPTIPVQQEKSARKILLSSLDSTPVMSAKLMELLMPWNLVEGFSSTLAGAHSMGYARNPSVIMTSNNFDTNDEFKAHLINSLPGAKYVVGQHGNNYGVSLISDICPEQNSADYFLSWGWENDSVGLIKFGQIKPKIRVRMRQSIRSVHLFLRDEMTDLHQADMTEPNRNYFGSIIQLCEALDGRQVRTFLRLHTSTSQEGADFLRSKIDSLASVEIAPRRQSIKQLLRSGHGVVFTYDSTGMLEMASAKIPFFAFIPDGLGLIRDQFKNNYEVLRKAGLLSEDPSESAELINEWISKSPNKRHDFQKGVARFAEGIVKLPTQRLRDLRRVLRGVQNMGPQKR